MKYERPPELPTWTKRQPTGEGTAWFSIGYLYRPKSKIKVIPIEVFARIGKSGYQERAWAEGLTRCISIGLQQGVPFEEYIKQLEGITGGDPYIDGSRDNQKILSVPDALAQCMKDFKLEMMR